VTKHAKEYEIENIPVSKAITINYASTEACQNKHKRKKCQMRNQNAPLILSVV
jgi:hypothetical protein